MKPRRAQPELVDWGVATRSVPGEELSGDRHLVKPFRDGVLLAVVDGLGHGPSAAEAAETAVAALAGHAEHSVISLLHLCHEALLETRGVVLSLATLDWRDRSLTWAGVGNVLGVLMRADPEAVPAQERLLLRGGVVGYQLPQIHGSVLRAAPGDTLVFATDGVSADFADTLPAALAPQEAANSVLERHAKGSDDALVLVARIRDKCP